MALTKQFNENKQDKKYRQKEEAAPEAPIPQEAPPETDEVVLDGIEN